MTMPKGRKRPSDSDTGSDQINYLNSQELSRVLNELFKTHINDINKFMKEIGIIVKEIIPLVITKRFVLSLSLLLHFIMRLPSYLPYLFGKLFWHILKRIVKLKIIMYCYGNMGVAYHSIGQYQRL